VADMARGRTAEKPAVGSSAPRRHAPAGESHSRLNICLSLRRFLLFVGIVIAFQAVMRPPAWMGGDHGLENCLFAATE